MSETPTIGVIGTKIYTFDTIEQFSNAGIPIEHLITLNPKQGEKYSVAGYHNLRELAERYDIQTYNPDTYTLDSERDIRMVNNLDLDLLLVAGWSRLIPEDILSPLSIGALGAHGSPEGLPKGRGRAVLNWALINQEDEFHISIFFLTPGVDSGDIIETMTFEINEFDTASSLRYKTWWAFSESVINNYKQIISGRIDTVEQSGEPTYYPKRKPEDGAIDWHRETNEIHSFVRALTSPYPGAFTYLEGEKVLIWQAVPFDSMLDLKLGEPGTVLKVFCDGEFLVETKDSAVLVTEYSNINKSELEAGNKFQSIDYEETLEKIRTRYPKHIKSEQKEI